MVPAKAAAHELGRRVSVQFAVIADESLQLAKSVRVGAVSARAMLSQERLRSRGGSGPRRALLKPVSHGMCEAKPQLPSKRTGTLS